MTLQQLLYVTAIAESGSINGAANLLQVSQSCLSSALSNLEREVKIIVFQRHNRGVSLTPDGEEFLGYARRAIDEFRVMEERYSARARRRRRFAVAAQPSALASAAFASVAREFSRRDFELEFEQTSIDDALRRVETHSSEIAAFALTNANRATATRVFYERDVEFIELVAAPLCVYFSAKHPLAEKKKIDIERLATYPRVTIKNVDNRGSNLRAEFLAETRAEPFEIQTSDLDSVKLILQGCEAYAAGFGLIDCRREQFLIREIPLVGAEEGTFGYLKKKGVALSEPGSFFIRELQNFLHERLRR